MAISDDWFFGAQDVDRQPCPDVEHGDGEPLLGRAGDVAVNQGGQQGPGVNGKDLSARNNRMGFDFPSLREGEGVPALTMVPLPPSDPDAKRSWAPETEEAEVGLDSKLRTAACCLLLACAALACSFAVMQFARGGLHTALMRKSGTGKFWPLQEIAPGMTESSAQLHKIVQGKVIVRLNAAKSADFCQAACVADSACTGWTFYTCGVGKEEHGEEEEGGSHGGQGGEEKEGGEGGHGGEEKEGGEEHVFVRGTQQLAETKPEAKPNTDKEDEKVPMVSKGESVAEDGEEEKEAEGKAGDKHGEAAEAEETEGGSDGALEDEEASSRTNLHCELKADLGSEVKYKNSLCAISGVVNRKEEDEVEREHKSVASCSQKKTCATWVGQVQSAQDGLMIQFCDVLLAENHPAEDRVQNLDREIFAKVRSSIKGEFVFSEVPPGAVEEAFLCDGFIPEQRVVHIPEDGLYLEQRKSNIYAVPLMLKDGIKVKFEWSRGEGVDGQVFIPGGCVVGGHNVLCKGQGGLLAQKEHSFGPKGPQLISLTNVKTGKFIVRAKYPKSDWEGKADLKITVYMNNKASGRYVLRQTENAGKISVDDTGREIWTVAEIDGSTKTVSYFDGDPSKFTDVSDGPAETASEASAEEESGSGGAEK